MKDIKVIVATHKKYKMPEDKLYFPIHVGKEGKNDIGFIGDNTGDNISVKNPNFCELTGLYWAWKNLEADYIGLTHYRRHFSIQHNLPKDTDGRLKRVITLEEADKLFNNVDIILPKILAGVRITKKDIAVLGNGGLCIGCEICRYPVCPFGK